MSVLGQGECSENPIFAFIFFLLKSVGSNSKGLLWIQISPDFEVLDSLTESAKI